MFDPTEQYRTQRGGSGHQESQWRLSFGGGRSFAILRAAKLSSIGNIKGSLNHTFRERETPNADPDRLDENTVLKGEPSSEGVLDAWRERLPEKVRKNAVLAVEYVATASPEAMAAMTREEQDAYFADTLRWLEERHGADNVLSAVIHRDETTPHLSAMVIPLDDRGKLNARRFLGGRKVLSEMQDDFAEQVGHPHGLDRGLKHSRARHTTIREFYGRQEMARDSIESLDGYELEQRRNFVLGEAERIQSDRDQARALLLHSEAGFDLWQRYRAEARELLADSERETGRQWVHPGGKAEDGWWNLTKERNATRRLADNAWRAEFDENSDMRAKAISAERMGFEPLVQKPADTAPRHEPKV